MSVLSLLGAPVTASVIAFLMCCSFFDFLLKITPHKRENAAQRAILFSVCNAFAVLVINQSLPQVPMWWGICALPLLIMAELYCIVVEEPFAYLGYYCSLLLVLFCVHGMTVSAIMLLRPLTDEFSWQNRFSITMLIATLLTLLCARPMLYTNDELSDLFHSKTRGMLPLCYSVASCIVMLITDTPIYPLAAASASEVDFCKWEQVLFPNLLLKNLLILASYFLILLFSIYQQRAYDKQVHVNLALQREQQFRHNLTKGNIFSYCANLSTDRLEEFSIPQFLEQHKDSSYRALLFRFFNACVHPEDRVDTRQFGNLQYYTSILTTEPSYNLQLRVQPNRMANLFGLDWPGATDDYVWVDFSIIATLEPESHEIRVYVSITDINARVTHEAALSRAAKTDAMTGLLNRATLEQAIAAALDKSPRGAMFIIDMDHFKEVNDTLGHRAGDELIRQAAAEICAVFREGDIIGRMGGDEFCVFVQEIEDAEAIRRRAILLNRLSLTSAQPQDAEPLYTTLSIGIARAPQDGTTYEELYECADRALYRAKRAGRNTFRFY